MDDDRSRLGLDDEQGFLEKLGQFLATLILGPLIGLLLFLALDQPMEPLWRVIGHVFVESLAVFWCLLLIFTWWRPRWLRRIYLSSEKKVVLITSTVAAVAFVLVGSEIFVGWVRAMKF
jgi:small-conductance mechanosensitive channel